MMVLMTILKKLVKIISDKDKRFKLINLNSNKGVTYARNLGLELATTVSSHF